MDSEEFASNITEKPYPKYQFQPHRPGPKPSLNAINRAKNSINEQKNASEASESLYEHHTHLKTSKKGYCAFCIKQERKPPKKRDLGPEDFSISEY